MAKKVLMLHGSVHSAVAFTDISADTTGIQVRAERRNLQQESMFPF